MKIEIINTGTELMLGRVLNTHQQWLCRQLADVGYVVERQTAVPDTAPAILESVREALTRSDLIITTGGLGPTSDDRTRELVAELLDRTLRREQSVMDAIQNYFGKRNKSAPPGAEIQAMVPEGATILLNEFGTAPGLAINVAPDQFRPAGSWLYMLPGPPRELRPMFSNQVLPLIRRTAPLQQSFVCRTLKTTGIGESILEQKIASPLQDLIDTGLELGYCARIGEVDVRLMASGAKAARIVEAAEGKLRGLIGENIFGIDDDELEQIVIRLLADQRQTVALAESCTGGFVAHRLTNVSGASAVFLAGLVTYSNDTKEKFLGVRPQTLAAYGAVSEATAREMADGARARAGADYALSVTGIAGPSGGTDEKPVGTVFIGLASASRTEVSRQLNPFDRETFKYVTSQQALEMLRRDLIHLQKQAK